MRNIIGIHVTIGFILIVATASCSSAEQPQSSELKKQTDSPGRVEKHVYKRTPQADMEIFIHLPEDWQPTDNRPAIVFFFGGGFFTGRIAEFTRHANYLASRGMVAARADYRVADRHGTMPDKCVEDAKSAVRWLRSNANKFGIDPNRIAASGSSAGGHMSACTFTTIGLEAEGEDLSISSKPNLLALFNSSLDHDWKKSNNPGFREMTDILSPNDNLTSDLCPTILFYGMEDPRHLMDGLDFVYKSGKLGNTVELYVAEGQSHNSSKYSPWFERTLYRMDQFLAKQEYLSGEPTIRLPQGKVGMSRMTPNDSSLLESLNHTPLHIAARSGDRELVQALIADGVDVNLKNRWGQTALYLAAYMSGDMEIVQILVDMGADLNVKDKWGYTLLHTAVEYGDKEFVTFLISKGGDVNISANLGQTPIELAIFGHHTKIVELLLSKGAEIPPLHLALFSKDEAKAKDLIEAGANVNERTPYGTSSLHIAVLVGLADITMLLIENGVDINTKDNWDWTALHSAAEKGHKEVTELLIAEGANVNANDGAGRTPLCYAKDEGHTEIAELLRKHGAKEQ